MAAATVVSVAAAVPADEAEGALGGPHGELLEFATFTKNVFVDHDISIRADSQLFALREDRRQRLRHTRSVGVF